MNKRIKIKGFTLVELLIIITIIVILIIIALLKVNDLIAKSRDSRRKADLFRIKIAMEEYYNFAKQFPNSIPDCGQPLVFNGATVLNNLFCDPQTKSSYFYSASSDLNSYRLYTTLENPHDQQITNLGCQYGCGPGCVFNYGVSSLNVALEKCLPSVTPTPESPPDDPSHDLFACSPGGGSGGHCELYNDPYISECPAIFPDDPTCHGLCSVSSNRCKNSSGKH